MGGLEILADATVVATNGKEIMGLYTAGEVAGGGHGNSRLGGNSLLDCVCLGVLRVFRLRSTGWVMT